MPDCTTSQATPHHDMTDRPDDQDALLSDSSSQYQQSFDLEYPQLILAASLPSLLSHSYRSDSASTVVMEPDEQTKDQLGESWVNEDFEEKSQDEDILSQTTDDRSVAYTEDDDSEAEEPTSQKRENQEEADITTPSSAPEWANPFSDAGEDSQQETIRMYRTEEHVLPNCEQYRYVLKHGDYFDYVVTMACYEKYLNIDTSVDDLNVVYFDSTPRSCNAESTRTKILEQISDAIYLATDGNFGKTQSRQRRYSFIPTSFGPGARPMAELYPVSASITIQECLSAEKCSGSDIRLSISGGNSINSVKGSDGSCELQSELQAWTKPDLIVICTNGDPDTQRATDCNNLMTIASRHGVPALLIRTDNGVLGNYDQLTIRPTSLHEACEETDGTRYIRITDRVPVSLETFLRLDPSQLAMHLATATWNSARIDNVRVRPEKSRARTVGGYETPPLIKRIMRIGALAVLVFAIVVSFFRPTTYIATLPAPHTTTTQLCNVPGEHDIASTALLVSTRPTLSIMAKGKPQAEVLTIGQPPSMEQEVWTLPGRRELVEDKVQQNAHTAQTVAGPTLERAASILQEAGARGHAMIERASSELVLGAQHVRELTQGLDFAALRTTFKLPRKSDILARAQDRAQRIISESEIMIKGRE